MTKRRKSNTLVPMTTRHREIIRYVLRHQIELDEMAVDDATELVHTAEARETASLLGHWVTETLKCAAEEYVQKRKDDLELTRGALKVVRTEGKGIEPCDRAELQYIKARVLGAEGRWADEFKRKCGNIGRIPCWAATKMAWACHWYDDFLASGTDEQTEYLRQLDAAKVETRKEVVRDTRNLILVK